MSRSKPKSSDSSPEEPVADAGPAADSPPAGEGATPSAPSEASDAGSSAPDATESPADAAEVPSDEDPEAYPEASTADAAAAEAAPVERPGEEASEGASEGKGRRRKSAEAPATPPPPDRLEGAVEAVLLAAGESLSAERIRDLLGLPSALHVRDAIAAIRTRWVAAGLAVEIQEVAGGHRVVTRPEYAEYVRRLWRRPTSDRLSQTLLETLSIVAYKQPVARAEIERIRGVQCGETLRGLLERRLVKVAGRSDQPGRPLLYATTARFLEVFGLAGLEDLPSGKDLARL